MGLSKPKDRYKEFWLYLSPEEKELILEGEYLVAEIRKEVDYRFKFKDYSFLIFPFAKAYEGFLKRLFYQVGMFSHLDYISNHLRLGRLMSPNLVGRLGKRSLYKKIKQTANKELADKIWQTWKEGRNEIFHFFPHNLKSVGFNQAESIINKIIQTMVEAYQGLRKGNRLKNRSCSQIK